MTFQPIADLFLRQSPPFRNSFSHSEQNKNSIYQCQTPYRIDMSFVPQDQKSHIQKFGQRCGSKSAHSEAFPAPDLTLTAAVGWVFCLTLVDHSV